MNIKDVRLKKGMSREEVNELISEWLTLEDEIYLGNKYRHNWKCKCGNIFERTFDVIHRSCIDCGCVEYNQQEQRYKYEVEKTGEYEYIRSYRRGDVLPDGKSIKQPYIQIKHKYCGSIYEIVANNFINQHQRCGKCCGSYENSFVYHIEVELDEPLDKYWDFEKNTVNPYHISKNRNAKNSKGENTKVWIKCTEKDYHESYEISCGHFAVGKRCPYCNTFASKKVHPFDSFGYKHFDKVMSWHPDNDISPFRVAPNSNKKYKFICPNCHHVWKTDLCKINIGKWCPECSMSKGEKEIIRYLRVNNIEFISQKDFHGLLGIKHGKLRYDFYLPEYNLLIEYQGEFHDGNTDGKNKEFYDVNQQKEHDRRKRNYAQNHNINLLEIWYWDFDNIEEILKKELNI